MDQMPNEFYSKEWSLMTDNKLNRGKTSILSSPHSAVRDQQLEHLPKYMASLRKCRIQALWGGAVTLAGPRRILGK